MKILTIVNHGIYRSMHIGGASGCSRSTEHNNELIRAIRPLVSGALFTQHHVNNEGSNIALICSRTTTHELRIGDPWLRRMNRPIE